MDAVNEMLYRTDTKEAPWTVVEANNKLYARLKVLETMIHRMERCFNVYKPVKKQYNESYWKFFPGFPAVQDRI